jgi:hypothetical protein
VIVPVAVYGHFKITLKEFIQGKRSVMVSFGKPILSQELFEGFEDIPGTYETIAAEKVVKRIASLLDDHMKERMLRGVRSA